MSAPTATVDVDDDDDYVLQVMTRLDLDAENLHSFRCVRDFLRHRIPLCCIAFHYKIAFPYLALRPNPEQLARLLKSTKQLSKQVGVLSLELNSYGNWASAVMAKAGFPFTYTPCPACILAGNFIRMPAGCPCCRDAAETEEGADA